MCCASYNYDALVLYADLWIMVFNADCLVVCACNRPADCGIDVLLQVSMYY